MKCRNCGQEFTPVADYQRIGVVCGVNCCQDIYNETAHEEESEVEEE